MSERTQHQRDLQEAADQVRDLALGATLTDEHLAHAERLIAAALPSSAPRERPEEREASACSQCGALEPDWAPQMQGQVLRAAPAETVEMVAWLETQRESVPFYAIGTIADKCSREHNAMLDRIIAALSPSGAQPVAWGVRNTVVGHWYGFYDNPVGARQNATYANYEVVPLYASPSPLAAEGDARAVIRAKHEREQVALDTISELVGSLGGCDHSVGVCYCADRDALEVLRDRFASTERPLRAAPSGQREEDDTDKIGNCHLCGGRVGLNRQPGFTRPDDTFEHFHLSDCDAARFRSRPTTGKADAP